MGRPPRVGWCGFPPSSLFGGAALVSVACPFLFGVVLFFLSLMVFAVSWVLLGGVPLSPSSFLVLFF